MRLIGTLAQEDEAQRLSDHLIAQGMTTRVLREGDGWALWVHHEDHVPRAREELEAFRQNPGDPRFQNAAEAAREVRRQAEQLDRRYRKNVRDLSGRWDRTNFKARPLTVALIAVSVVVFLLTSFGGELGAEVLDWLSFTSFTRDEHGVRHSRGLQDILHGQVWRLVTPIFLHFHILHILFNMWWTRDLGTLIEYRRGTKVLAALVFLAAIASNCGEFAYEVQTQPLPSRFGGMSGVVYALFGYVWMRGRRDPTSGMMLHPRTVQMMLLWLVICFTGMIGPVANVAHVVGLVVGVLFGLAGF